MTSTHALELLPPPPGSAAESEELLRQDQEPLDSQPLLAFQRDLVNAGSPLFSQAEREQAAERLLLRKTSKHGPPFDPNLDLEPHLPTEVPTHVLVQAIVRLLDLAHRPTDRIRRRPPQTMRNMSQYLVDGQLRIPSLVMYGGDGETVHAPNVGVVPATNGRPAKGWSKLAPIGFADEIPEAARIPWNWPFHNLLQNYLAPALHELFRHAEEWKLEQVAEGRFPLEQLIYYGPDERPWRVEGDVSLDAEPEGSDEEDAPGSYGEIIQDQRAEDPMCRLRADWHLDQLSEDDREWFRLLFEIGVRAMSPRIPLDDWKEIFPGEPYDPERARSMPGVPGFSPAAFRKKKSRLTNKLADVRAKEQQPGGILAASDLVGGVAYCLPQVDGFRKPSQTLRGNTTRRYHAKRKEWTDGFPASSPPLKVRELKALQRDLEQRTPQPFPTHISQPKPGRPHPDNQAFAAREKAKRNARNENKEQEQMQIQEQVADLQAQVAGLNAQVEALEERYARDLAETADAARRKADRWPENEKVKQAVEDFLADVQDA